MFIFRIIIVAFLLQKISCQAAEEHIDANQEEFTTTLEIFENSNKFVPISGTNCLRPYGYEEPKICYDEKFDEKNLVMLCPCRPHQTHITSTQNFCPLCVDNDGYTLFYGKIKKKFFFVVVI